MDWTAFAEFSLIGLLSGGLLAMIALGFVLIYKGTGVINFAMGEFMMLGAYFFYTANVMWRMPTALALLLALAAVALTAALFERAILRPLSGQPVRKFHLLAKELDHDDGEVTATMKVKRASIAAKYGEVIEAMYGGA